MYSLFVADTTPDLHNKGEIQFDSHFKEIQSMVGKFQSRNIKARGNRRGKLLHSRWQEGRNCPEGSGQGLDVVLRITPL